jgi:hypothetical protein
MASPDCNGICFRFKISISNNKASYEDGYIRCSGCNHMITTFEKVDQFKKDNPQFDRFKKYRCPCCNGLFKTNRRHKKQSEAYKNRNKKIDTEILTTVGTKKC